MEDFSKRANTYDQIKWVYDETYMNQFIGKFEDAFAKKKILVIGPGTGPVTRELCMRYKNQIEYFDFIEPTDAMYDILCEKMHENGYSHLIRNRYLDWRDLADEQKESPIKYDLIIARSVLHHFPSLSNIYECIDCLLNIHLKSKGMMIIGEGCPPPAFPVCINWHEQEDIIISQKILCLKEDRLNYLDIINLLYDYDFDHVYSCSDQIQCMGKVSIDNWLDKGSTITNDDVKKQIKDMIQNMPDNQKERFGVEERNSELFWNSFHNIITLTAK